MFFNSERSTGKSYTTQGFLIERFFEKKEKFVYITRTKDEIKNGVFEKAFMKVLNNEFSEHEFEFKGDKLYVVWDGWKEPMGYAVALTEVTKKKKENLDGIRWMLFDEYILDEDNVNGYIGGWKEPELLLNLYHTLDRERDFITVIFLANSIKFYNPYHLHPAFHIRKTEKNKIFKSENVLYLWFTAEENIQQKKNKCKFIKMLKDSDYGNYAVQGEFINDTDTFVRKLTDPAVCNITILCNKEKFGVWVTENFEYFLSDNYNKQAKNCYALSKKDMTRNSILLTRPIPIPILSISNAFKHGRVYFTSHLVQEKLDDFIRKIL